MERDVFLVLFIDNGRIPLRVLPTREAAVRWCIKHAEWYLQKKRHPRSGVRPVQANEIFSLGYDIVPCKMEE